MFRNLGAPEIIIIAVLLIVVFGWKRLPDAARSLGRSARVFKSEVEEMKNDKSSSASSETVKGETVAHPERADGNAVDEVRSPHTDNQSGPAA